MKKFSLISKLFVLVMLMFPFITFAQNHFIRGDADGNGKVSIDDVTCLIDYLLKGSWPEDQMMGDKIKVLFVGNSFTANSVFYLPFIFKNGGLDRFKIAFMFSAGASLQDYVGWFNSHAVVTYEYDSDKDVEWQNELRIPAATVADDDWDLIVLQQSSKSSIDMTSYMPYTTVLDSLITNVMSGKSYQIGWNINHARGAVAYNYPLDILANIHNNCQTNGIGIVLPYGTAIFNALTVRSLRTAGGGFYRNLKHGDNTHLSPGLSMYIASLAIAQALSDYFSLGFSAQNDMTEPLEAWSDSSSDDYKGISPTYGSFVAITENTRTIAKAAVAAAIASPFAITQLNNEHLSVIYNCDGCHIEGDAPTSLNYGEKLSFRIVADDGKEMQSVQWRYDWRGVGINYTLGADGLFEMAATDNLIITAVAI